MSSKFEEQASGFGCIAVIAAVTFLFFGIETQRKMFFKKVGYPTVPQGKYAPVSVLSSDLEHNFGADKYVLTMRRIANPYQVSAESDDDSGFPAVGILYTLECSPHFWNLCAGLAPGQGYYARWTSNQRTAMAVAEIQADGKFIDTKKTREFAVRGWKKAEE